MFLFVALVVSEDMVTRVTTIITRTSTTLSGAAWTAALATSTNGGCLYAVGNDVTTDKLKCIMCEFKNSQAKDGGGLWIRNIGCTLQVCTFQNCKATANGGSGGNGGGAYFESCAVVIQTGSFINCEASASGGGFYAKTCVSFQSSYIATFSDCSSQAEGSSAYVEVTAASDSPLFSGGTITVPGKATGKSAVYIKGPGVAIDDLTLGFPSLSQSQAPLFVDQCNNLKLTTVSFNGGTASSNFEKGVIQLTTSGTASLVLDNCKFNDVKSGNGGALYGPASTDISAKNCQFTNVQSTQQGGAIHTGDSPSVVIEGCTIKGARSGTGGCGIFISAQTTRFQLVQTIFTGNSYIGGIVTFADSHLPDEVLIQGCTFQDHTVQASSDPTQGCFIKISSVSDKAVTLSDLVFNNNEVSVKGLVWVTSTSVTLENCSFTDSVRISSTDPDYRKAIVFVAGGSQMECTLSDCHFTGCEVSGSGGIFVSSDESNAKLLATSSMSQITLSECEFTRCVSDTDPELSLVCNRLNISGSTFVCSETQQSSFMSIHVTSAESAKNSIISGTFTLEGTASNFQHAMIEFASDAGTKTDFQACTFSTKTEGAPQSKTRYVNLMNSGDVAFAEDVEFDTDKEESVSQNGDGKVEFPGSDVGTSTGEDVPVEPDSPQETTDEMEGHETGDGDGNGNGGDDPSDTNKIVGIVCGVLIPVVAIVVIVVVVIFVKKRKNARFATTTGDTECEVEETVPTGTETLVVTEDATVQGSKLAETVDLFEPFDEMEEQS